MDVIDLKENQLVTRPVSGAGRGLSDLRLLASQCKDDFIGPLVAMTAGLDQPFARHHAGRAAEANCLCDAHLRNVLKALEVSYNRPVDIEFTAEIGSEYPRPGVTLHLLQCRPYAGEVDTEQIHFPDRLPEADIIFGTEKLVPTGRVENITNIIYVAPEQYNRASPSQKLELGRLMSRLNQRLEGQTFIMMGPGRWGSSSPDLGLKVGYADFYNTRALVEISWSQGRNRPALSYGTHFFQDLVEARIYPLAIFPGDPGNPFNHKFFETAVNALPALLPRDAGFAEFVKVIDVPATTGGRVLELVMSGDEGRAVAFLTRPRNA